MFAYLKGVASRGFHAVYRKCTLLQVLSSFQDISSESVIKLAALSINIDDQPCIEKKLVWSGRALGERSC